MLGGPEGPGMITIRDCKIHNNKEWGVRLTGGYVNGLRITDNIIRQNGTQAAGAAFNVITEGGGIYVASGTAVDIRGNDLEGQAVAFRSAGINGLVMQTNYSEAMAQCSYFLDGVTDFAIEGNYLAADATRAPVIFLKNCLRGRVAQRHATVYMKRCIDVDVDGPFVPRYANSADAYADPDIGWTLVSPDKIQGRVVVPKQTVQYAATGNVTNATYADSTTIPGPRGEVDFIKKVTCTATSGYVEINTWAAVNVVPGDWVGVSAWVYVPAANATTFLHELREDLGAGFALTTQETVDTLPKGAWYLWRLLRKIDYTGTYNANVRITPVTNGEFIYLYSPECSVWSSYPTNPHDTVDTLGQRWQLLDRRSNELIGAAAPTAGTWPNGARIKRAPQAVGSPKAWSCSTAGTPGTHTSEGNL